jgi:RHS repeat-associated protein
VVAEYDGANTLRASYVTVIGAGDLPGMPLETNVGGTATYPLVDGVGSVTGTTDVAGAFTSFAYTAYGTPVGASSGTYAYGTYGYDSATGLYYARARYYDPSAGRFLSADPLVSLNLYAYAADSPGVVIDPSGADEMVEYPTVIDEEMALYRAVGPNELTDIVENGIFRAAQSGRSMEVKEFWTTAEDAGWFARSMNDKVYTIVRAVIPKQLGGALQAMTLDGRAALVLGPDAAAFEVFNMAVAIDVLTFIPFVALL